MQNKKSLDSLHRFKAEFFKTLGHPLRLAILDALREGEKSVSELRDLLGVEQSTLSQQLAVLRQRGFVAARREGAQVYYATQDPEVYAFLDLGRKVFERQLQAQTRLLGALRRSRR
ncbi:metalloregulator ArsR/SmtB family transcription factor [Thermus oshimai]|jgi:ArsR family transcriptional regulator|uniref:ArsR/SmtB family transcription factor n=1 Tax=Thermus sp. TaxID=275 RepID=UPI0030A3FB2D